jgi:prepilin-type N-terminal cleavage/methylation domain-containing protein
MSPASPIPAAQSVALPLQRRQRSSEGFSLVELLVGMVLVAIASAGSALVLISSNNTLQTARTNDRSEALIDDDVARMQELSTRLTCCSGACTTTPATVPSPATAVCLTGASPGDKGYYYPVINAGESAPFLENPATATPPGLCNNGGIGNAMVTAMNASGNAPDADFTAAGLSRTPARVDAADGRNHLVRVTYSSGLVSRRVVYVLPPAASWCP